MANNAFCIKKSLSNHKIKRLKIYKNEAAVLIPIVSNNEDLFIIFTKRSEDLPSHGGEISFPGGMYEPIDKNLGDTALRETFEEIGLKKNDIEIIGRMDDQNSFHNHKVSPYIGMVSKQINDLKFTIAKTEVTELLFVPFKHFYIKDIQWTEKWMRNNVLKKMYFYRYKEYIIWGLTAEIVYKLTKIVSGCFGGTIC